MPSLPELQRGFAADMLNNSVENTPSFLSGGVFSGERLLSIYRNNINSSLAAALSDTHPSVAALVGDEYFIELAKQYLREYPPRQPNLHAFGDCFDQFLVQHAVVAQLPYLSDIARLDWAWHCAFHATDATPLEDEKIALVPVEEYARLRFQCVPSVVLIASDFPIYSIREFCRDAQANPEASQFDMGDAGERVLVYRTNWRVSMRSLPVAEWAFLNSLKAGYTLGDSIECAVEFDPAFELNAVLNRYFADGIFSHFYYSTVTP